MAKALFACAPHLLHSGIYIAILRIFPPLCLNLHMYMQYSVLRSVYLYYRYILHDPVHRLLCAVPTRGLLVLF